MKILHSKLLTAQPGITHGFTTRLGGESPPPYAALNLAYHVGDDSLCVDHNHTRLSAALAYQREEAVWMHQVHGDCIHAVDDNDTFDAPPTCDALMSGQRGKALIVMSADCTPVLLYDPVHQAVAAVHAGRAGALNAITATCIHAMNHAYATRAEDMIAVLGPSIHGCCYEVNAAIAQTCQTKGYEFAISRSEGSICLDVNAIILRQLKTCGVPDQQIEVLPYCTACNNDTFFSYRADKGATGRQAGIIILR